MLRFIAKLLSIFKKQNPVENKSAWRMFVNPKLLKQYRHRIRSWGGIGAPDLMALMLYDAMLNAACYKAANKMK
jgi:hypothetical protein